VSGNAPSGAAYVVPAVVITGRVIGTNAARSPMVHFSGASLAYVGSATTYSSDVFIKTLTLTDSTVAPFSPLEEIGATDGSHPDQFFLGEESS
jgi:hypothetical protein